MKILTKNLAIYLTNGNYDEKIMGMDSGRIQIMETASPRPLYLRR